MAGCTFGADRAHLKYPLITERCFLSACCPKARDGTGNQGFVDPLARMYGLGGSGINTRAGSVRHTDAVSGVSPARP